MTEGRRNYLRYSKWMSAEMKAEATWNRPITPQGSTAKMLTEVLREVKVPWCLSGLGNTVGSSYLLTQSRTEYLQFEL